MKQIKKILCYVDPIHQAKSAIEQTLTLAKLHDAQVCFVSVLKPIPSPISSLQAIYVSIQKDTVTKLLKEYGANPDDSEIRIILGSLGAFEITAIAVKEKFDLVIKPTDGKGHTNVAAFGSNDQQLLRRSPVPVWINKSVDSFQCKRLLAAVDIDRDQPENSALNRDIIALAKLMARTFDAELHVVHAWHMPYVSLLEESGFETVIDEAKTAVQQLKSQREQDWRSFLEEYQLDDGSCVSHYTKGEVDIVISELSVKLDVDTVVMGTVARTGIEGFFIGNTAEKILSKLKCSVLAIKPEAFKPPVK